jgi:YesN/AraC family two-component response regulator
MVEAKHPNVALLDVRMPIMDGIRAARVIKKRWPQVKVILISLYSDYEEEALESGADAFLVKGCPTNELISTILGETPKQT